ncbi:MAG: hypothetical protein EKK40_09605 [Bradyrhizobiaceae bacterium]|nr:MAG: hypothetical protein EKK40_09605 [Bradyrhizobiaceae bacterium]
MVLRLSDIEYLTSSPASKARSIAYVYRTGHLRRRVISRIAEHNALNDFTACAPNELLTLALGGGLFAEPHWCDWSHHSGLKPSLFELQSAMDDGAHLIVVIVSEKEWTIDSNRLSDSWLVIEEREIDLGTVDVAVRYFCECGEIHGTRHLWAKPEFSGYFREVFLESGAQDIRSFQREFEKTVLLHTDGVSGDFKTVEAVKGRQKRSQIAKAIKGLLVQKDQQALSILIAALSDLRRRSISPEDFITQFVDVVCLTTDQAGQSAHLTYRQRRDWIIWLGVLIRLMPRFYAVISKQSGEDSERDISLVLIDEAGRQFIGETSNNSTKPFVAMPDVSNRLMARLNMQDSGFPNQFLLSAKRFIEAALGVVRVPWVTSLHEFCLHWLKESERSAANSPMIVSASTEQTSSLDVIAGQDIIINSLKGLFGDGDHSVPILLFGADELSRRTIAMAYVRALMCETRARGEWSACGTCAGCVSMENGNSFGFLDLRIDRHNVGAVREKLTELAFQPFSDRRVVLINGLDRVREIEEAFLDVLERGRAVTTFILNVENLDELHLATVSRCFIYRVQPQLNKELTNSRE